MDAIAARRLVSSLLLTRSESARFGLRIVRRIDERVHRRIGIRLQYGGAPHAAHNRLEFMKRAVRPRLLLPDQNGSTYNDFCKRLFQCELCRTVSLGVMIVVHTTGGRDNSARLGEN